MSIPDEIKARVDARQCLEFYGVPVDRRGFAKCPFHQGDNTGSLKVYDGDRGWHCFGCGAGTSVVDFVMQYFGFSFIEAQKKLNDDFGLGLQMDRMLTPAEAAEAAQKVREQKAQARQREDRIRALREAVDRALTAYVLADKVAGRVKTGNAVAHRDAAWYNYCEAEYNLDQFKKGA